MLKNFMARVLVLTLFISGVLVVHSLEVIGSDEALHPGEFHATRLWLPFDSGGTIPRTMSLREATHEEFPPTPEGADSHAKRECSTGNPSLPKESIPGT